MFNLDFEKMPSGSNIQILLTDQEATKYTEEYLDKHKEEVKELISQKIKIGLDVSEPKISFDQDEISLSARVGKSLIKTTAKATASVIWDGSKAHVNIKTLAIPVIKIEADKANGIIQQPVHSFIEQLQKDFIIKSFKLQKGIASVDAVKK